MNFKQIAVVAALALSSTGTLADVFNVNVMDGTASFNHSNVVAGELQDVWNFNIAGLVTADAVSYTHLDVYKRQHLNPT